MLQLVEKMITHYGFVIVGIRKRKLMPCWKVIQIIIKSGDTIFILTQKNKEDVDLNCSCKLWSLFCTISHKFILLLIFFPDPKINMDEYPVFTCCKNEDHVRDSVFNVCLEVDSVFIDTITKDIQNRYLYHEVVFLSL